MNIKTTVDAVLEVNAQGTPVGRSDQRIISTAIVRCHHVPRGQLQVRCTTEVPPTTDQGIEVHITGLPMVTPTTMTHLVSAIAQLAQKLAHDEKDLLLEEVKTDPKFDKPVSELKLSGRPKNRLAELNVRYIGQLVQLTRIQLSRSAHHFSDGSLKRIEAALAEIGLSLKMDICDWVPPDQRPATPPAP